MKPFAKRTKNEQRSLALALGSSDEALALGLSGPSVPRYSSGVVLLYVNVLYTQISVLRNDT
jgi:hypothetical protein